MWRKWFVWVSLGPWKLSRLYLHDLRLFLWGKEMKETESESARGHWVGDEPIRKLCVVPNQTPEFSGGHTKQVGSLFCNQVQQEVAVNHSSLSLHTTINQCKGESEAVASPSCCFTFKAFLSGPALWTSFFSLMSLISLFFIVWLLSEEKGSRGRSAGSYWSVSKRSAERVRSAQKQTRQHLRWGIFSHNASVWEQLTTGEEAVWATDLISIQT